MDCPQIKNLLTAFQDAELTADDHRVVEEHIRDCAVCAAELAELHNLRNIVRSWSDPEPPSDLWDRIERVVHPLTFSPQTCTARSRKILWAQLATVAALALIALGTGLWAYRLHLQQPQKVVNETPPRLAIDLDRFLNDFQHNPQEAPQWFLAHYNHEHVVPDKFVEVAKKVRYETITPNRLSNKFSVEAVYLLKMECCTGVQCILKRKGAEVLAILQHTIDQPVWYGKRKVQIAQVLGRPTRIVRTNGRLAATWRKNGTYVSVIGAKDMNELTQLIASLGGGGKGD